MYETFLWWVDIFFYYKERIFGGIYGNGFLVKITETSKKFMPDSEPEPPYEGAKPMLPVTILEDRTSLQNMVEEMYPESQKLLILRNCTLPSGPPEKTGLW